MCLRGTIVDGQPRLAGPYLLALFKMLWAFGGCPAEERQDIEGLGAM